ncbi:MAG: amidase [Rhodospirillales bacterium]|jgi:amidase|uniref:amidase n=1 Tax=Hwanghaeella sp. 1Z406 TaxID=3402811 RepID=UPI000C97E5B8|nr:amidase [Rhodospirillales bacterium]|tara:strand:- start:4657 stop:6081 length:1425 start_codon:yes stop_codon:yes gene_type:complete
MTDLIHLTACAAVDMLKAGDVTPQEMVDAAYDRIEAVDGAVNATPILCRERAEQQAKTASRNTLLAGLPVGIKDLSEVEGVRCTYGSPIFKDYIPNFSDIPVVNLERHGAVLIGKTNTPEFGAGANTFNAVFGITRNPWDISKSCAGSSGGSAVALATGQCWLASGSDLGGSLRTPASFCGIVGLRPSPGRVPRLNPGDPFGTMSVEGPMGRTVEDTALMLDAMAGQDPRDPISQPLPHTSFRQTCRTGAPPRRIAYSLDLGGIIPVDPAVEQVFNNALKQLEDMGVELVETCPDFSNAIEAFKILRGLGFVNGQRENYEKHRNLLKDDVIWNYEYGRSLTAEDIAQAQRWRGAIHADAVRLFTQQDFDAFLCPTAIVPPYPAEQLWVDQVNGQTFDNYIHWLAMVSAITLTGLPAISVPAGFTEDGLPVGVQLVGAPFSEGRLLAHARHFESATGLATAVPIDPKGVLAVTSS